MGVKKTDLVIVNRSFWPDGKVIGEGLLQFAEKVAETNSVMIITQSNSDLSELLSEAGRGHGIQIKACRAYTTSSSGLIMRVLESVIFMLWTLIILLTTKPKNVYVSTNPPIVIPFIVALYCQIFNSRYVYHLQDIHPEATDIVVPLNHVVLYFLKAVDNYTLRHASVIITLSESMKDYIQQRSATQSPIFLLDNPSFTVIPVPMEERTRDIVFCGNAGRLQRIPLLLSAIRGYLEQGGRMCFTFAGTGVYASQIQELANIYGQVHYLGLLSVNKATELVNDHRWALLPIDDEVTKYAFPSKSSGYALSGAGILAICKQETSVARWVLDLNIGLVCEPEYNALVSFFFMLEGNDGKKFHLNDEMRQRLQMKYFSEKLRDISMNQSLM